MFDVEDPIFTLNNTYVRLIVQNLIKKSFDIGNQYRLNNGVFTSFDVDERVIFVKNKIYQIRPIFCI